SVRKPLKRWLGPFAYVVNGFSLMRTHAPFDLRVTADGRTFTVRANVVIGANSSTYVYGLRLAKNASIHDGLIDLCVLEAGRHPLGNQVFAACCNRLGPGVGANTIQARKIHIESDPQAAVQIDGDPAGSTPLDIECIPGALSLVVPDRYARRLERARKAEEMVR
ncbi:MAG: hypothetical protein LC772_00540, partial [Chloroflexi bacterium]|nr:hypothetical protein [Chloroflexota bacterium]